MQRFQRHLASLTLSEADATVLQWTALVSLPAALLLVVTALLLAAWRLWRGPTEADRILALALATGISLALTVVLALVFDQPVLLDVAVALAVIGFVGTAVPARRLERKDPSS